MLLIRQKIGATLALAAEIFIVSVAHSALLAQDSGQQKAAIEGAWIVEPSSHPASLWPD